MSSGRIGALIAVPMASRGVCAGPVSSLRAKTVACGVSTPSQPPDQTMGMPPTSAALRLPCARRTPRKAVSERMRVKSLTPPLPSVLPITATTESAAMRPVAISASRPDASVTDPISTFATSMAMSSPLPAARRRPLSSGPGGAAPGLGFGDDAPALDHVGAVGAAVSASSGSAASTITRSATQPGSAP